MSSSRGLVTSAASASSPTTPPDHEGVVGLRHRERDRPARGRPPARPASATAGPVVHAPAQHGRMPARPAPAAAGAARGGSSPDQARPAAALARPAATFHSVCMSVARSPLATTPRIGALGVCARAAGAACRQSVRACARARATMHDRVDRREQRHRVAEFERRGRVDQHVVVFLRRAQRSSSAICGAASSAGGFRSAAARPGERDHAPARREATRWCRRRRRAAAPPVAQLGAGTACRASSERERAGEHVGQPGCARTGPSRRACAGRRKSASTHRRALARFALDEREVGDDRSSAHRRPSALTNSRHRDRSGARVPRRSGHGARSTTRSFWRPVGSSSVVCSSRSGSSSKREGAGSRRG